MTPDNAVNAIKVKLGFRTTTGYDATIITELNNVQEELQKAQFLPLFLLAGETSLVTVADTRTVAFPTGFLREYEEDGLKYYPDDLADGEPGTDLKKDEIGFLRTTYPGGGEPIAYGITTLFSIFPLPDDVYTLKLDYYKADSAIVSGGSANLWLTHAPKLIVGKAGMKLAQGLRDEKAVQYFEQQIREGQAEMVVSQEALQSENRPLRMGGED